MNTSEVARLRQQIEMEIESMQGYRAGYVRGAARHDFIRARLEHIGHCQTQLADHLGEADAARIVYNLYASMMEEL